MEKEGMTLIAEQDVKYLHYDFKTRRHHLNSGNVRANIRKRNTEHPGEASLSSDIEWLRQQAWQKVVVNADIWEALGGVSR